MIARVWRGVVARGRQADYVTYVGDTGVAEYRKAQGCRLSAILTRDLDPDTSQSNSPNQIGTARVEVIAFSIWDDEAAIQALAGPDINAMVLYPEDQEFLLEPRPWSMTRSTASRPPPLRRLHEPRAWWTRHPVWR